VIQASAAAPQINAITAITITAIAHPGNRSWLRAWESRWFEWSWSVLLVVLVELLAVAVLFIFPDALSIQNHYFIFFTSKILYGSLWNWKV
jgi:hypothetical protein